MRDNDDLEDKDLSRSGEGDPDGEFEEVADRDGETHEDEEDDPDKFPDAGENAIIGDGISSYSPRRRPKRRRHRRISRRFGDTQYRQRP